MDDGYYLYIRILTSLFGVKFRVIWSCRWRIEQSLFCSLLGCNTGYVSAKTILYAELETATCLDHILLRGDKLTRDLPHRWLAEV